MSEIEKDGTLALPAGITEEQLTRAVLASGYPLQNVVALELQSSFKVVEEWGYVDRNSQEHRSLDLLADLTLQTTSARLQPHLTLLIECKRSELPYVFFSSAIRYLPPTFPTIVGFKNSRFELHRPRMSREVSAAEFLKCSEIAFMETPTIVSAFSRVERKGKELELSGTVPYNSVVLPLASALGHYCEMWSHVSEQERYSPTITLCVCIVDAAMIVVGGTPEQPQLKGEPWIRIVRQEAAKDGTWWKRRHYVVDVVNRRFLPRYVSDHLVPMAEEIAARMIQREDLVIAGKGAVDDFENWSWQDIQPL